jgi:hypothetical protein
MGVIGLVLAALAPFLIGGLYYSPAGLLPMWFTESKRSGRFMDQSGGHGIFSWVVSLAASFVAAYAMRGYLAAMGADDAVEGALSDAWVGGMFVGTSLAINGSFGGATLGLIAIDAAYHVLQFAVYGAVLCSAAGKW